ncbi:helix-turn-helix domain-containing protein [Ancylobacter vacuolatus]|uniref:helix-turn-helix domain-containing protein n=1 Tax=Ancylobacter vacuolatus TaxID=223389 RepID=UPI003520FE9F
MQQPALRERVRAHEAAGILGISVRAVQSLAAKGELPGAAKIGGLWTFDENTLRSWLKAISTPETPAREPRAARPRQAYDPKAWPPLQAKHSAEAYEKVLRELRQIKG